MQVWMALDQEVWAELDTHPASKSSGQNYRPTSSDCRLRLFICCRKKLSQLSWEWMHRVMRIIILSREKMQS